MKSGALTLALLAMAMFVPAQSADGSAIDKVMTMLADLAAKIEAQGSTAKVTFEKFSKNCKAQSVEYTQEITTTKTEIEELSASITKETSTETKCVTQIEELSASISTAEQDLAAATKVRNSEAADFAKEEKELLETIDTIERAISILSKELSAGASMLQTQRAGTLVQALTAMVQASMLTQADASRLTALTQMSQESGDSDSDADMEQAAPAGAVYESHSGGIIDTLENLLEKAQAQLEEARKTESTSIHNYQMLKQSLTDEIKYTSEDMSKVKITMHSSKETKSISTGDLSVTKKSLATTMAMLKELEHDCRTALEEYEEGKKSRAEELAAVKKATVVLQDAMKSASFVAQGSNTMSFVQVGKMKIASRADLSHVEAVRYVRNLARKQHSLELSQLASRMDSVMKMGAATGQDPFAKVKGLIGEMINRLEEEGGAEDEHKAYCDKQLSETRAKKDSSMSEVKGLSVSLDQSKAHAAKLKEQIAELEKELAASSKAAAEAGVIRQEEKAEFEENEKELSTGLKGVKLALKVLKEYYAKDEASEETSGAASGIVSLLEVVESDLSKSLVEIKQVETTAAAEYEEMVQSLQVSTASKQQDVKYKTKEVAALAKKISELEADLAGVQTELDATLDYLDKISKECTSKVEPYAEKKARREAEIAGLKEALSILEGEMMFLQRSVKRRALRGVHAHRL
mmetsp:Transcript_125659/g.217584  ORF Transcript_125659/g.217584 Transcript_125659/m.217584 type:complete len:694 (-) Transcript_125659:49-2130(-)